MELPGGATRSLAGPDDDVPDGHKPILTVELHDGTLVAHEESDPTIKSR